MFRLANSRERLTHEYFIVVFSFIVAWEREPHSRGALGAAFDGAANPSLAPSIEHQGHASDTRTFLADHGLECCIDPIMRNPSFLAGGAGVDSPDDVRFLSDEQIAKLPIPEVKRTILMALASEAKALLFRPPPMPRVPMRQAPRR